jgi:hypothetical protein
VASIDSSGSLLAQSRAFTVNYHSWWVAEEKDAVYNIGNTALGRIATGAADRHIGQEIDVQVSRALTPQLHAAAGYAHIVPGGFLKEATPGAIQPPL